MINWAFGMFWDSVKEARYFAGLRLLDLLPARRHPIHQTLHWLQAVGKSCPRLGHVRSAPKADANSDRGLHPPIKNLATPVHSPHLSFTSIFPKFSPLNNLRKAMGAFSMPCSMVSFHVILPSCIHLDISLWNSGM